MLLIQQRSSIGAYPHYPCFGTFRISVTSEGTATPEELNARHVKAVKLLFLPSADLKRNLEGITFEVPHDAPETPTA